MTGTKECCAEGDCGACTVVEAELAEDGKTVNYRAVNACIQFLPAIHGKALITDGPFAETKEQLAGYYILDCENLDEAIEWAAKIPTACKGGTGCIEIRPMPGLPSGAPANG